MNGKTVKPKSERVGLIQWLQPGQFEEAEKVLNDLQQLKITHLKINISPAEPHTSDAGNWYDFLFNTFSEKLEILPFINCVPAREKAPAPTETIVQFVEEIISRYGDHFDYMEFGGDVPELPSGAEALLFYDTIVAATTCCKLHGKKVVLGSVSANNASLLQYMLGNNLMNHIDVVGLQGFPDVFDYHWDGWKTAAQKIAGLLQEHGSMAKLWVTAAGFSTWQKNERRQLQEFIEATSVDVDRVYWYSLNDLPANMASGTRFHLDEREYHFGIRNADGSPKLLHTLLSNTEDLSALKHFSWMAQPISGRSAHEKYTFITGGAGFVGINLANRILSEGRSVLIFDNLSRAGVHNNLLWLREKYPENLQIMIADIRDKAAVKKAVEHAEQVFHFAAQVAVTSSLIDPHHDFEVNALGTLNLLEAIRNSPHQPPVVFTSTNKVYGDLHDIGIEMNGTRYHPEDLYYRENGISEKRNLDFHSPYGCTKGIADQYMLDYARTFGLKAVVFRMSCIYGPHQFGTEDQGWVAHFLIQALKGKSITLYGDGRQVRDILFVDDLVNAFLLAQENMELIRGNAFNIGGGSANTISLLELLELIGSISGKKPEVVFETWRPSDQKYYVSDFSKFNLVTGWKPANGTHQGVEKLFRWLEENVLLHEKKKSKTIAINSPKKLETIVK